MRVSPTDMEVFSQYLTVFSTDLVTLAGLRLCTSVFTIHLYPLTHQQFTLKCNVQVRIGSLKGIIHRHGSVPPRLGTFVAQLRMSSKCMLGSGLSCLQGVLQADISICNHKGVLYRLGGLNKLLGVFPRISVFGSLGRKCPLQSWWVGQP